MKTVVFVLLMAGTTTFGIDGSEAARKFANRSISHVPWLKKQRPDEYVMFDSIANLTKRDRNERLKSFASAIKERPGYRGYVISYGKKGGRRDESLKTLTSIKTYLTKTTKIVSPDRIVFIDGGASEGPAVTNFYLVPLGAPPPIP